MVVGLTVVLGVLAGFAGSRAGVPPAVIWAVLFPSIFLYWFARGRGHSRTANDGAGVETLLLDVADTRRRVIQVVVPVAGTLLGAAGVAMWVRAGGGPSAIAVSATVVGIALIVVSLRLVIGWDVSYKGHAIRFQNDPCFGERLYIDGQLVARGGVGLVMELSGAIPSGEGAGETIRATSRAGVFSFSCRIVALTVRRESSTLR